MKSRLIFALLAAAGFFLAGADNIQAGCLLDLFHHGHGCCEASCCAPEPTCCAPEPTCCEPEPACCDSCGHDYTCGCHNLGRKVRRLFSCLHNHLHSWRHSCCEPACCEPEPACGCGY